MGNRVGLYPVSNKVKTKKDMIAVYFIFQINNFISQITIVFFDLGVKNKGGILPPPSPLINPQNFKKRTLF
jgi:hypothetical protein